MPRSTVMVPATTSREVHRHELIELMHHWPEVSSVEELPEQCRASFEKVPTVGVSVKVISLSDINMAGNTFMADININVCWIGAEDAGPQIQLYNMVDQLEFDQVPAPVTIEVPGKDSIVKCRGKKGAHDGITDWSYYYRIRVRGILRQGYKLAWFPFDTQHLTVAVRLKSRCVLHPVRWGLAGEALACDPRCMMDEFVFVAAQVEHAYLPSYKFASLDGYDPEARLVFSLARKPIYWIVSYGAVASLICSLITCTYSIPVEDVSSRLNVAMTLVLTMTATKYLMAEKMPAVSYLTLLDAHIVMCCGVLLGLTAIIGTTAHLGHERIEHFEEQILPTLCIAWAVYHGIALLALVFYICTNRSMM